MMQSSVCLEDYGLTLMYHTGFVIIKRFTILRISNRIPTRGQQQKSQSCLLPVDSGYGTTIVMSDCTIVTSGHQSEHLYQTIVQFDKTIVLPRKLATGSIHLLCYCPLVGILFEVLRIINSVFWSWWAELKGKCGTTQDSRLDVPFGLTYHGFIHMKTVWK